MQDGIYKISDLAMMTQLSEKTIRNYMKDGRIKGQKLKGTWTFTEDDIRQFFEDDFIKQSVMIKNHCIVDDFMKDNKKKEPSLCVIYDYPCTDEIQANVFCAKLMNYINAEQNTIKKMSYYYDSQTKCVRLILTGDIEQIRKLLNHI